MRTACARRGRRKSCLGLVIRTTSIKVLLADAGVEFMVIGGQAEALMGSARVTYDVDLCYRRTRSSGFERRKVCAE